MSRLQQLLAFRRSIAQYLTQLSRLTGTIVSKECLLSLNETAAIRERSKAMERAPSWRETLEFSEKRGPRFQHFVRLLRERNPSDVYIWTLLSNDCGLLRPVSLET